MIITSIFFVCKGPRQASLPDARGFLPDDRLRMRGNVVQKVPGNRFQDPGVRLKERDKVKGSKFKAGDKVEATIDSVAFGGHGVARIGEMVLFAPFTVDQDVAEIRITEIRKNYLRGKLERILVPSPWRDARSRSSVPSTWSRRMNQGPSSL